MKKFDFHATYEDREKQRKALDHGYEDRMPMEKIMNSLFSLLDPKKADTVATEELVQLRASVQGNERLVSFIEHRVEYAKRYDDRVEGNKQIEEALAKNELQQQRFNLNPFDEELMLEDGIKPERIELILYAAKLFKENKLRIEYPRGSSTIVGTITSASLISEEKVDALFQKIQQQIETRFPKHLVELKEPEDEAYDELYIVVH